jgi:hypothetical protein
VFKSKGIVAGFPPRLPGFNPRSDHVGKLALEQVFSEYFGFPRQFSFHRQLHTHHLSSGTGTIGQLVADVPRGLSLTPPHPKELKKRESKGTVATWTFWMSLLRARTELHSRGQCFYDCGKEKTTMLLTRSWVRIFWRRLHSAGRRDSLVNVSHCWRVRCNRHTVSCQPQKNKQAVSWFLLLALHGHMPGHGGGEALAMFETYSTFNKLISSVCTCGFS